MLPAWHPRSGPGELDGLSLLWRRQREQAPQPAAKRRPVPRAQAVKVSEGDREALIDQIAALDNAFTAGEMAEADYRKRREALKTKLLR